MDRPIAMFQCAATFAIAFGIGGYVFGGLARLLHHKVRRIPEGVVGRAFSEGAKSGTIFAAILGLLMGAMAGYFQVSDPAGVGATMLFFVLLACVSLVAVALGTIGYFLEWLGAPRGQETEKRDAA